jgi:hypothetical protein
MGVFVDLQSKAWRRSRAGEGKRQNVSHSYDGEGIRAPLPTKCNLPRDGDGVHYAGKLAAAQVGRRPWCRYR